MKIKFCGIRRNEDVDYVNETHPDYIGFIFAPTRRQVTPEQAKALKNRLDPGIKAVGVFVDETPETVAEIANEGIIDLIQLHGSEDAAYIKALRGLLQEPVEILKAVRVRSAEDIQRGEELDAEYLLLDKYDPVAMGGTGQQFDWSLIGGERKPFFLAGGISAENLEEAMRKNPYGIDVSSGIETDGCKDLEKMKKIMEIFRRNNG